MRVLVLCDHKSLGEWIKLIKYQNGKYVTKILSCISFWFKPPCLSKMKELNQIILGKGHLFLTKGHLDNPEGPMKIEKKNSFQNGHF